MTPERIEFLLGLVVGGACGALLGIVAVELYEPGHLTRPRRCIECGGKTEEGGLRLW